MPFTALKIASEQRLEIWTKRPTIPAASRAKAVESLAYIALDIFL